MSTLLEAEHLTKIFTQRGKESFKAVDDVSFTLKPGETLGIVGESGSGKSTLAKMITRLTDITEGTLKFEGKDITRLKHNQLKDVYGNIQMVFQNPVGSFDPRRTLGDGIGESLRNRGMKKADIEKRVAELLEQCGLSSEFAKRYPHEVSGGQCQRAAIARALAIAPRLLICDEITSALDVTVQKEILELLNALRTRQGRGLSILFICHDISLVQQFCDRVLVMYHGEIVEEGTPDEVVRKHGYKIVEDNGAIEAAVDAAFEANPDVVEKLKSGNMKPMGVIIGAVMKATRGQADAKAVTKVVMGKIKG